MNAVDCLECKNIPNCLKENPSAQKLSREDEDKLLESVADLYKVNFGDALTIGECGRFPLFPWKKPKGEGICLTNQAIGIPRCLLCLATQKRALQLTL